MKQVQQVQVVNSNRSDLSGRRVERGKEGNCRRYAADKKRRDMRGEYSREIMKKEVEIKKSFAEIMKEETDKIRILETRRY